MFLRLCWRKENILCLVLLHLKRGKENIVFGTAALTKGEKKTLYLVLLHLKRGKENIVFGTAALKKGEKKTLCLVLLHLKKEKRKHAHKDTQIVLGAYAAPRY